METILEILKRIRYYSVWDDCDSKSELILYLDEIHGLAIDAMEMLKKLESIRLETIKDNSEEIKLFEFERGN